jgi:hypothetical protein
MSVKSRTYLVFFAIVAVFATALVLAWSTLGNGAAIVASIFLLLGAAIGFRRVREDQEPPGVVPWPTLVHALPRKWARWIMDDPK